jgi:chemotaxis protein methyltransferase CheR
VTTFQATAGTAKISGPDFATVADQVRTRSGIALSPDQAYLVESRLGQLVRARNLAGFGDLASKLRSRSDEGLTSAVVDATTTNETLYFRDIRPFEHLRMTAVPAVHCRLPQGQPLRIWSASASSGQEAYSIAMTVADAEQTGRPVEILATDISQEQLQGARLATYNDFEGRRGLPRPRSHSISRRQGQTGASSSASAAWWISANGTS